MIGVSMTSTTPEPALDLRIADMNTLAAHQAGELIERICSELRKVQGRELRCRLLLGKVLLEIRERELWKGIHGGYSNWMDFLRNGFPKISNGLKRRTAHDCMDLARSRTLSDLPDSERDRIAALANARRIAKLERAGRTITPALIIQAQELPPKQFVESSREPSEFASLRRSRASQQDSRGPYLERIVAILATASPYTVRRLADAIDGCDTDELDDRLTAIVELLDGGSKAPSNHQDSRTAQVA
jgi:hypothetical protein